MYIVRDVFQLKFGKARDAQAIVEDLKKLLEEDYGPDMRFLVDFTGAAYRLIFEGSFDSLAVYEERLNDMMSKDQWRAVYGRFVPLVDSSNREILRVI